MKSITIPVVLMILLTSHSLPAQTRMGLTAGASFANATAKIQGMSASAKLKAGITAGIFAYIPLGENFSCQPALNFVQKGYIDKDESSTEKVEINYVEVPLNFVYTIKRNEGFFIGAGPSIAYGVSGRHKITDANGFPEVNEKIEFGSGEEKVKTFDFGANILAGYKCKGGFMISGNYNLGLSKINNGDDIGGNGTIKNRYFAIKIGCVFGRKK